MNPRRVIVASYVILMAAFIVGAGAWFTDAHAEYRQLKMSEASNEQLLADAKRRLADQQKILERLKSDPLFVDKVIRQNLYYARPSELIFRFED